MQDLLDRKDWRRGRARSRAAAELAGIWFAVTIWTALSVPMVWKLTTEPQLRGTPWAWLIGLFVFVGVWILFQALRQSGEWLRFGRMEIELDPSPGSLGGHVGGSLRVGVRHRDPEAYRVTLACVRSTLRSSGENRSRREAVVWSSEIVPSVERSSRGVRLRFTFQVPDDLPPSEPRSEDYTYWSIRVVARVPGLDLDRAFEVPVVAADKPALASTPAFGDPPSASLEGPRAGPVRVERRDGATVLKYPAGRERGISTGLFIAGLVFVGFAGGGGWFLAQELLSPGGTFAWIAGLVGVPMVVLFGSVGLLFALLGLYNGLNALEVTFSDGQLEVRRSVLGIGVGRSVPFDQVEGIEMKINGQLGQGSKAAVFYGIRAHLRNGSSMPMGDGLRGPTLAEEVAGVISDEVGIPVRLVDRRRKLRKRARSSTPDPE
jgi:hypothetical protein